MDYQLNWTARILGWLFYALILLTWFIFGLTFGYVGLLICVAVGGGLIGILSRRTQSILESAETEEELTLVKRRITTFRVVVTIIALVIVGWALNKDLSARGQGLTIDNVLPALGLAFFSGGGLFMLVQCLSNPQAILQKMNSSGLNYSLGKIKALAIGSILAGLACGLVLLK